MIWVRQGRLLAGTRAVGARRRRTVPLGITADAAEHGDQRDERGRGDEAHPSATDPDRGSVGSGHGQPRFSSAVATSR